MSLRRRIMLLTLGVAAMVLLLFAVPLLLVLQQAAREGATERATDVANGVADYVSTSAANGHGVDESTLKTLIEILKIFISMFTGTQ